jgi:hypothetical protein
MGAETFQVMVSIGVLLFLLGISISIGIILFLVFASLNETVRNMRAVSTDLRAATIDMTTVLRSSGEINRSTEALDE